MNKIDETCAEKTFCAGLEPTDYVSTNYREHGMPVGAASLPMSSWPSYLAKRRAVRVGAVAPCIFLYSPLPSTSSHSCLFTQLTGSSAFVVLCKRMKKAFHHF